MSDSERRLGSRTRSAVFAPIGEVGRAAGVERRLAEAIRSGILVDGERLPSESELGRRLGVATVTAREALVGLRSHGLVTTLRGRGGGSFVVSPRTDDEVDLHVWLASMSRVDLADRGALYSTLLAGCAEVAAERATAEDVHDLRSVLEADRQDGERAEVGDGSDGSDGPPTDDPGTCRHTDTELHLTLAAMTHSARLAREVMRMEADFGTLLRLPLAAAGHRTRVREHQRVVVDAVAAGDPDAARARMRKRVRETLEDLAELQTALR